jgi:hypothetical protein
LTALRQSSRMTPSGSPANWKQSLDDLVGGII